MLFSTLSFCHSTLPMFRCLNKVMLDVSDERASNCVKNNFVSECCANPYITRLIVDSCNKYSPMISHLIDDAQNHLSLLLFAAGGLAQNLVWIFGFAVSFFRHSRTPNHGNWVKYQWQSLSKNTRAAIYTKKLWNIVWCLGHIQEWRSDILPFSDSGR